MMKRIVGLFVAALLCSAATGQPYYQSTGGSIVSGTTPATGCTGSNNNAVLYTNGSGKVSCGTSFTHDGSGTVTATTFVGALTGTASNASQLLSGTWAIPGTIGSTTPNTGKFSTLTDTGLTAGRVTFAGTGGLLADTANLTWAAATGQGIVTDAGTVTTAVTSLKTTQAFNAVGVSFPGVVHAFTGGAIAAVGTNLFDITLDAAHMFRVLKTGQVLSGFTGASSVTYSFDGDTTSGFGRVVSGAPSIYASGSEIVRITSTAVDSLSNIIGASAGGKLALGNGGTFDAFLHRTAAVTMSLGTSTAGNASGTLQLANITASGSAITLSGLGSATGTPSSLCLNGTTVTVNAALTCTVSSARFKDDMRAYDGSALSVLSRINPSTFTYKDHPERDRIGFIAEELAAIDPRLAERDADGRPNSIDFPAIMAVIVKAVQELKAEVQK